MSDASGKREEKGRWVKGGTRLPEELIIHPTPYIM
jgi:hypothetical protein